MKVELDLDPTYNQPSDDSEVLNLIDGPVHLIELSKTNVQRLLTIANEVEIDLFRFDNARCCSFIQLDTSYQANRMKAEQLTNTLHALYERLNLTDSNKYIKLPLDKPHRPANRILVCLTLAEWRCDFVP